MADSTLIPADCPTPEMHGLPVATLDYCANCIKINPSGRGSGEPTPPPVRLIRQEHDYGCGIASLAMIDRKSYDTVRSWLLANWPGGQADSGSPPEHWLEKRGIHKGVADWYLAHHGYVWRTLYAGWAKNNNPSFPWPPEPFAPVHLACVRQPSGNSHYVVLRADGVVLDPMTDEPRTLADWPSVDNVQGVWAQPTREVDHV